MNEQNTYPGVPGYSGILNQSGNCTTTLGTTGAVTSNLLSGTTITSGMYTGTDNSFLLTPGHSTIPSVALNQDGITLSPNLTINYKTTQQDMAPKQVNVAVFTITRDSDTNEINSTKFVKELWIEQKNGTSIDLLVAKQLGDDFDPECTIIKVLATVSF